MPSRSHHQAAVSFRRCITVTTSGPNRTCNGAPNRALNRTPIRPLVRLAARLRIHPTVRTLPVPMHKYNLIPPPAGHTAGRTLHAATRSRIRITLARLIIHKKLRRLQCLSFSLPFFLFSLFSFVF